MTNSRGTGITIDGSKEQGYWVSITAFDKSRVIQILDEHGIKYTTRSGGRVGVEPDETLFVFDSAIDAESVQEIIDDAE